MMHGFDRITLYTHDEKYAPPEQPLLQISVVGDTTFLSIRRLDETHLVDTLTTIAEIGVRTGDLVEALAAAIIVDKEQKNG